MVCDLVAGLLRHMEDKHASTVTPSLRPADAEGTAHVLPSGEVQLRLHHAIA
ncbi:hypothetical protein [Trebonia kvetii]|uniref:hypothetical protein n=1 Tax=Trebonia kvetii TaxID=2480626 RepID=UPI0016528D4B|nr:hypothetical protein [Trebonia kvetii]